MRMFGILRVKDPKGNCKFWAISSRQQMIRGGFSEFGLDGV